MLISSERIPLLNNSLHLPSWIRAPLSLSRGSRYFAAIESSARHSPNPELIISSFDYDIWDYLWRLEIDTDDTAGNAYILIALLIDRKFKILSLESSTNTYSMKHSTSIVISSDAHEATTIGKAGIHNTERGRHRRLELDSLRREIIAYLGDKISFNPDGSPAIKLRRIRTYRDLANDVRSGDRILTPKSGSNTLCSDHLILTTLAQRHIWDAIGKDDITYSPAVDTKDRIIRVMFFSRRHPVRNYIRFSYACSFQSALPSVYRHIYDLGGNVIRNTIRTCPPHIISSKIVEQADPPDFNTADITFDFDDTKFSTWSSKIKTFDKLLKTLSDENPQLFFILKHTWGQHV